MSELLSNEAISAITAAVDAANQNHVRLMAAIGVKRYRHRFQYFGDLGGQKGANFGRVRVLVEGRFGDRLA